MFRYVIDTCGSRGGNSQLIRLLAISGIINLVRTFSQCSWEIRGVISCRSESGDAVALVAYKVS